MARRKYTDVERKLMATIAFNLKRILNEKGLFQKDLAGGTKLSTSVISDYLTAKTLATPGSIQLMSEFLQVQKADIDPTFAGSANELTKLPVINKITLHEGSYVFEDIFGFEDIPNSWINKGDYFCFRPQDDSMLNARILSGDTVLIRQQETVKNGEIALLLIKDTMVLRRVFLDGQAFNLSSENPKYPAEQYKESEINVIGKPIKVIINF